MTSVLVVQPRDIKSSLSATQPFPTMTQTRRPSPPSKVKAEGDFDRLRRPPSQAGDYEMDDMDSDNEGEGDMKNGNSSNSEGPIKKRRRSRKGLDKKFECPTDGCGKSYSRAEHL